MLSQHGRQQEASSRPRAQDGFKCVTEYIISKHCISFSLARVFNIYRASVGFTFVSSLSAVKPHQESFMRRVVPDPVSLYVET